MIHKPEAPAFLAILALLIPVPFFLNQSFMALGDLTLASGLLAAVTLLLPVGMLWTLARAGRLRNRTIIDRVNILESTRLAMAAVIRTLASPSSVAVTDHVDPGDVGCEVHSPKKADRDYFSVAAASIVAKVHRDRLMVELARKHPAWAWQKNKGYGTVDHRKALQTVGPSRWHRVSFRWSPVLP